MEKENRIHRETVLAKLQDVFCEVFPENYKIGESTTANDIPRWDSLNHIILIKKIEERFNISFGLFEIIEMKSVGDIVSSVHSKIG